MRRAATIALLCLAVAAAHARLGHGPVTAFDRAERQREALENRPQPQRTRAAYEQVLEAYRDIYRGGPSGPEAAAAVDAVASLLAEEGRGFHDVKLLQAAIEQYAYLRRTYPASPFRQSALLSQAEIAQSDLHDGPAARQAFAEFLRLYPSSPLAGEARQQLKALPRSPAAATVGRAAPGSASEQAARNRAEHARELAELNAAGAGKAAPGGPRSGDMGQPVLSPPPSLSTTAAQPSAAMDHPILITGIRHWSTPVYTRVAIDLSDEVRYEAARVPDPDRIYFDLHGARLAPELIGKSLNVIGNMTGSGDDGGFLRRVRVAPSTGNTTRVVLDVSHVSEYSAFFLPNPWRLIVDIHGANPGGADRGSGTEGAPAAAQPGTPAMAATTPAQGAGNSLEEVGSLANAPRRVKATQHPTTAPIAASVSGTTRAQQPAQHFNELEALSETPPAPASAASGSAAAAPAPTRPRHKASSASIGSLPAASSAAADLTPPAASVHEAAPTAAGERSLVRALGLKIGRIVIDAGHGGHDSGTLGPEGIQEKDVVLDVSLRLGKLLQQRLHADVIYTRDDDTFVPLETRTAIANKAQADLFLSVHANSSSDPSARGVEVYYLNFTTSPEALEVAARENAVSDQSIYQLSDLVKKIALKDKIDESHEFASDVEASLYSGLGAGAVPGNEGLKDRGVKKAPFVVLIGANMPSVLAEISFLTNPEDARELRDPAYRERIAESLYGGVSRYISGLAGVHLAQRTAPALRQKP